MELGHCQAPKDPKHSNRPKARHSENAVTRYLFRGLIGRSLAALGLAPLESDPLVGWRHFGITCRCPIQVA